MNVVIYARFSSHSQTEQSIEGQLKVCHEYAEANGHIVIDEYIDRAQSGTTDSRAEFQRMIADSDKHTFEAVLVYQGISECVRNHNENPRRFLILRGFSIFAIASVEAHTIVPLKYFGV